MNGNVHRAITDHCKVSDQCLSPLGHHFGNLLFSLFDLTIQNDLK